MRLPWPFQRRSQERAADEPADVPAAPPAAASRGEWRGLPALDETIGPPPLVAPNSRFASGLSINPPASTLAPLGHQRSLEAPHGLALGLAKPVSRLADGTSMASRPVANRSLRQRLQRSAVSTSAAPATPGWPAPEQGAGEAAPPVPPTTTAATAQTAAAAAALPAPVRRAPTVAPEAAVRPVSMTSAPAELTLASSMASAPGAASPSLQRAGASLPPNHNAVQSARSLRSMMSLGAPAGDGAAQVPTPIQRASSAAQPTAPAGRATKLTLAQSRRAGLGAPIAAKPVPGVQRAGEETAQLQASAPLSQAPSAPQTQAATPSSGPSPAVRPTPSPTGLGSALKASPATAAPLTTNRVQAPSAAPTEQTSPLPLARRAATASGAPSTPITATYIPSIQRAQSEAASPPAAPAAPAAPASSTAAPVASAQPGTIARILGAPGSGGADTSTTAAGPAAPTAGTSLAAHPPAAAGTLALRIQRRRQAEAHEAAPADSASPAQDSDTSAPPAIPAAAVAAQRAPIEPIAQHSATSVAAHAGSLNLAAPGRSAAPAGTSATAPAPAASPRTVARATTDGALFGTRPLSRPLTGVQRAAATGGPSLASAAAGTSAAPVRVLRDAAVAGSAAQLKAKAFTHAGDVYMPAHHGPLDSGPGRSLLAHELTHVQQQRDLGSALPAEHTPEGRRLERAAQAAEATGSPPLNLRLATPPATRANRSPGVAQRTSANRSAPGAEGDEQAAATISVAGTTGLSPVMAAPVQRVEEVSSAAPPAPAKSSSGVPADQQELEELATKLWERLRFRMRRELLHDRERAGMVADLS